MPVEIEVDSKAGVVVRRVIGKLSFDDVKESFKVLYEQPGFRVGMNAVWDIREGDAAQLTADGIKEIVNYVAQQTERRGSGYRVAIVAPRDVDFGTSRMFQTYGHDLPFELKVCRKVEEAFRWISEDLQ